MGKPMDIERGHVLNARFPHQGKRITIPEKPHVWEVCGQWAVSGVQLQVCTVGERLEHLRIGELYSGEWHHGRF